jgi:hypothetical protein
MCFLDDGGSGVYMGDNFFSGICYYYLVSRFFLYFSGKIWCQKLCQIFLAFFLVFSGEDDIFLVNTRFSSRGELGVSLLKKNLDWMKNQVAGVDIGYRLGGGV